MIVAFLTAFASLVTAYLGVAGVFFAHRVLKVIDLHEEHVMTRSREHKTHTKSHALLLKGDTVSDLLWPVSVYRKARAVYAWLK